MESELDRLVETFIRMMQRYPVVKTDESMARHVAERPWLVWDMETTCDTQKLLTQCGAYATEEEVRTVKLKLCVAGVLSEMLNIETSAGYKETIETILGDVWGDMR